MTAQIPRLRRPIRNRTPYPLDEDFQTLTHQIIQLANQAPLRPHFQEEVCRMILNFSGADEVELWLRDHGKYFRSVAKRHPPTSILFTNRSYPQNGKGELSPGPEDDPGLIFLCNKMMLGQMGDSPKLTEKGSLLVADSKKPLRLRLNPSNPLDVQMLTLGDPHPSLLLIPLRINQQCVGLLQLKSDKRNGFKKADVDRYEHLARNLEIAAAYRDAQIDLRERVKELTCLYGIARLLSKPNITLEEILWGIVALLPSAWLYPEIAQARILLDGRTYGPSPSIRERWKQTAEITVDRHIRGWVEIAYIEERPELDEGPFLREERHLLDMVAREVSSIIKRWETEREKTILENQLRHADRLATIGQLAAGVAHELNEPLGNILGFAQLALKCPGLPKQAAWDIEKILTASLNAREVVKKLLFFARQMPPRKTRIHLNRLIEETLPFFEPRCAKEGIELICSLDPDLPEILADPSQLTQVIVNLVINALQAMQPGGRLTLRTVSGQGEISLVVEDTGMGMDEEVMKQIFTPFFTTKEVGQGTGLGLPVVHGIVTSHGGSIKVESKPQQGSRFEVRLPVTGALETE